MKILFFGDITGEIGARALAQALPSLVKRESADFVIANGENYSNGKGLVENDYRYLLSLGIDAITLGNHWHNKAQIDRYIDRATNLVRPLNLLNYENGEGSRLFTSKKGIRVRVSNLLGQAFMTEEVADPKVVLSTIIDPAERSIHIVDYHAESTSEKAIFGYFFDGKVSAVLGTHTHVQTNDAKILPNGTVFMSDVGLCGLRDGIIGWNRESVMNKLIYGTEERFRLDDFGHALVNGIAMEFDDDTLKAKSVKIINEEENVL